MKDKFYNVDYRNCYFYKGISMISIKLIEKIKLLKDAFVRSTNISAISSYVMTSGVHFGGLPSFLCVRIL